MRRGRERLLALAVMEAGRVRDEVPSDLLSCNTPRRQSHSLWCGHRRRSRRRAERPTKRKAKPERDGPRTPPPAGPENCAWPLSSLQQRSGWSEAWWWLGIPPSAAAFALAVTGAPGYDRCSAPPKGYGSLETSRFRHSAAIELRNGAAAVRSLRQGAALRVHRVDHRRLELPLYRRRGDELGQHVFHWNTRDIGPKVNRQEETNLHNTYAIFEKTPRSILEMSIAIGGLGVPFAAIFYPWLRACRASLFLPANAMVPLAIGAMFFKVVDQAGARRPCRQAARPAERDDRDLSLCLHRRLSGHLRAADPGARGRARRSAEVRQTSFVCPVSGPRTMSSQLLAPAVRVARSCGQ